MRAAVCLPTYNERENLERMVRALGEQLDPQPRLRARDRRQLARRHGAIADALAASSLGWTSCTAREGGLGPAYLAGFRQALAEGAELIIEMDCDFSHDPEDVPRLIAACEAGADLALGSRYVDGGGTVDWGLGRRAVSGGGSLYARLLLGVRVRDLTGGFKCFRRAVLESIDLEAIERSRLRVPDRDHVPGAAQGLRGGRAADHVRRPGCGRSKMGGAIVLEAVWRVPALRWKALRGKL